MLYNNKILFKSVDVRVVQKINEEGQFWD